MIKIMGLDESGYYFNKNIESKNINSLIYKQLHLIIDLYIKRATKLFKSFHPFYYFLSNFNP